MQVPMLDLKSQYRTIREEILAVTGEIFDSQHFILGPHVEELEKKIAGYCGTRHAVGVSSGTDALLISLMAAGIGAGDVVITTPYTFFATAGAISRVGAVPKFADIDPATYNISVDSVLKVIAQLPQQERRRLKGIIPVHLYGQCADMHPLCEIADDLGLVLIEDAAQAIGARYRGKGAGSMGDFGCFSFFPSKNLGGFGDGGMVTTDSDELFEKMIKLRNHGAHPKYYHSLIGGNFRLDALQAAVVGVKLPLLDGWTRMRQKNAERYCHLFTESELAGRVTLPEVKEERHIYNQFVIRVAERRDDLREHLSKSGIGHDVYYPVPLHLQECFAPLGYRAGDLPASEEAAKSTLALPVYPEMTEEQQIYVVNCIKSFYS